MSNQFVLKGTLLAFAAAMLCGGLTADPGLKVAVNPYLPPWEHVPDAEPRVFGDRLYVYGSHDRSGGCDFCIDDYVGWSAPTNDLSAWRKEGVIFAKSDDPSNPDGTVPLYAPDCVRGPDGRYYLYYVLDRRKDHVVGVAVCDKPAGRFRYLGNVRYEDGTPLGRGPGDELAFDPAVLVDGERVFIYLGGNRGSGGWVTELKSDMLTAITRPKRVIPGRNESVGTPFEGHGFFEGASIRKIDGEYVLVYVSWNVNELCWATSSDPCGPFRYRGSLVRTRNLTSGNTHGGMVQLGGDWYVFYHRHTQGTGFSRQGCAERLTRDADGSFRPAELTSQGLSGKPLPGVGEYPAYITCDLYIEKGSKPRKAVPRVFEDRIVNLIDGTTVVFRYFDCRGVNRVSVTTRGWAAGTWEVRTTPGGPVIGVISTERSIDWKQWTGDVPVPDGTQALYFTFRGRPGLGYPELKSIALASSPCGTVRGTPLLDIPRGLEYWCEGIPLGNGQAGALVWGTGDKLNLTLDRADFWRNVDAPCFQAPEFTWTNLVSIARRRDDESRNRVFPDYGRLGKKDPKYLAMQPTKLPGVRLTLGLGAGQKVSRFRLDRETAAATVSVETPKGPREIVLWFPDNSPYLSMNVGPDIEIVSREFNRNPSFDKLGGYPEPTITVNARECIYSRKNSQHTNRFDHDFTAGVRVTAERPKSEFWPRFWRETARVRLPDPELQRLYDIAIYLYGAGARRGNPPIALQGLWTCDNNAMPPWSGDYHNDLNTEMTYWAAGPAGCVESLEAFADFYVERLPEFRAFARHTYGTDGAAIVPTMGLAGNGITGWTAYMVPLTHGLWVYCTLCDAYDYAPTPEKARKYLDFGRELAKANEACWTVDAQGVRRMDVSTSPEWYGDGNQSLFLDNTNYERAILMSFYGRLAAFARVLGETAEAEKWAAYATSFGPAVVDDEGVLLVAPGVRLTGSHRHLSHLASVFPLMDAPKDPKVDEAKSVAVFDALGTKGWCGYSRGWSACCNMRVGNADAALWHLKRFRDYVMVNGFHMNVTGSSPNRPFTLEGNFGYARGVQEMMLAYDYAANAVRLFPHWPKDWEGKSVSFENLRVPGGHRISAARAADGKVTWTLDPYPGSPKPEIIVPK